MATFGLLPSHEPIQELPGLWVSLDRLEYRRDQHGSSDRPHCFEYHITIHNDSPTQVIIKGRKWIVTAEDQTKQVIEGDRVAGEFPNLAPGSPFHYSSYHLISSNSLAEGAYLGITSSGKRVFTRIPSFKMQIPTHESFS